MGREVNSGWYCTPTKYGCSEGGGGRGQRSGGSRQVGTVPGVRPLTVQLDDLHPLAIDVLAHEAEAFVLQVVLEVGVDLRGRGRSQRSPLGEGGGGADPGGGRGHAYLKAVSVPFLHVLGVAVEFSWKTDRSGEREGRRRGDHAGRASLRSTLLGDLKMVRLFPNLMVPPICPGLCSGMSITCGRRGSGSKNGSAVRSKVRVQRTTGCFDSGSNSVELASEQVRKKINILNLQLSTVVSDWSGGVT